MTTLSFESIKYSPRKAAVRRAIRPALRPAVAEQQPVNAAIRQLRAAGARNKAGLVALVGLSALAHVGVIVALHRPATVEPPQPRVQPLAIEIAPPPPAPPPEPPKPQPRVAKAAPAQAAPTLPVVSPQAVDDGPPTADTVPVATTAPVPAPAPVVAAPPAPAPEPVTEPRGFVGYRSNPAPDYPALAQDRGMQGRVILKVHVLASGKADNITVEKSAGFKILDDAAIKAVLLWTFDPARRGQAAIDGWVTVPLNFKL